MNLEYAFFCEDIESDTDNTVTVTGIFSSIAVPAFPYTASRLVAALCLRFSLTETYESKILEMHLLDSDGQAVITPRRREPVQIPAPDADRLSRTMLFAHDIRGVRFVRPGDYQLSWLVNGIEAHSLPLRVSQARVRPRPPPLS